MKVNFVTIFFAVLLILSVEGKKTGRSRSSGSGRGSSKKTNPQPAPTSFSYPQPSAPKPSLFGWQEKPAQKPKPSNTQSHSYPSSGTGLSGDKPKQPSNYQESIQRSSASNNFAGQQGRTGSQQSHSYPASTGLSGSPGSGYPQQSANKYPQQQSTGLSNAGYPQSPGSSLSGGSQNGYPQSPGSSLSGGSQAGYPQQHGSGLSGNSQGGSGYPQAGTGLSGGQSMGGYPQQHGSGSGYPQQTGSGYPQAPPPYSRSGYGQNSYGNSYHHPQGPPPPYTGVGSSYGGFGGHGPYSPGYASQMPGYFGNYGNKGYGGGVSRTGSALTGVGIAGAGIGTVLTGLALWNLARSTGHSHHTVIYDNRGQPVAVAPSNDTATAATDSMLADLVNCSLTISNDDKTEVLAIPCAIATSFTPEADVKDAGINENSNDNTKCTVTVLTKAGKEFMTTIPCSILLNTAAENNVTEPPIIENQPEGVGNITSEADLLKEGSFNNTSSEGPTALKLTGEAVDVNFNTYQNLNCTPVPGENRDPINPCFSVNHDLTVIPLSTSTTNVPK